MAEAKEYLVQSKENGTVMISEEVIASIAALAVRDVEGVYGTSADASFELNTIFGKKESRQGNSREHSRRRCGHCLQSGRGWATP